VPKTIGLLLLAWLLGAAPVAAQATCTQVSDTTRICSGSGTPEGAVLGNIGDVYLRTDTTPTVYSKTSGAGTNTGWTDVSSGGGGGISGTAGTLPKFATATTLGDSVLTEAGGNLSTAGTITAPSFLGNATTASALAADPTDCPANQVATTINASGTLGCVALTDAFVPDTITVTLAATATALAADPADCTAGQYATAINASGTLTCATVAGGSTHALLSATHTDTSAAAVARGALLVGNSTPAWARLTIGGANTVLASNGTDAAWTSLTDAYIPNTITVDLAATATALAANPADCTTNQVATSINASGTLGCVALTDAYVPDSITVMLAATATALAANPADCSATQFATSINASGTLGCAALTDADVPNTLTLTNISGTAGTIPKFTAAGAIGNSICAEASSSLTCTGGSGVYALRAVNTSAVGGSFGLEVQAGSNTTNYAVLVSDSSASTTLFSIRGDGETVVSDDMTIGGALGIGESLVVGGAGSFAETALGLTPMVPGAFGAAFEAYDSPVGTGNAGGTYLYLGRNTSGNGSPGVIYFIDRQGVGGAVWMDTSDVLRIGSAPEEDGAPADTGGTVIGTQTSTRASKQVFGEYVDYAAKLRQILDTPLYDFTYRNGRYNGQRFVGLVTDEAPWFGLDRDAEYPQGKSLNDIELFGALIASTKVLYAELEQQKAEIAELKKELAALREAKR
jgi:hypothetical protein